MFTLIKILVDFVIEPVFFVMVSGALLLALKYSAQLAGGGCDRFTQGIGVILGLFVFSFLLYYLLSWLRKIGIIKIRHRVH